MKWRKSPFVTGFDWHLDPMGVVTSTALPTTSMASTSSLSKESESVTASMKGEVSGASWGGGVSAEDT